MKRFNSMIFIAFSALITLCTSNLFSQEITATVADKHNCFNAMLVADKVWQISGKATENVYLVIGRDSALVIDAGLGIGDLKGFIQTLTKLPLIVVNTHGHGDHNGFDYQFSKIYAHPDDFFLIQNSFNKERRNAMISASTKDKQFTEEEIKSMMNGTLGNLVPVKEGYVFDLGGRKLEVIETPGHTHGSICLLDTNNKILFAGDHCNALVWLFLKDCYPLDMYLQSLIKTEKMMDKYDVIMPGHNQPLDKTFMSEIVTCVDNILNGTCNSEPYKYAGFEATICKYKRASVAYDPNNLHTRK
jgi:glyoxylase-like metal-dependent hydrolase (beta-lactamase superfamily II)